MHNAPILLLLVACVGEDPPADRSHLGTGDATLTYVLDGIPWVHNLGDDSTTDLSAVLDDLEDRPRGVDQPETLLNIAPDGGSYAILTERFSPDCEGWACLAVVSADATSVEVVAPPSGAVHPADMAVASGGELVVFSDDDRKLWASSRSGGDWSEPLLISADSTYDYAWRPALSEDGTRVLFDCGDRLFPATAICEVGTDGAGFREVVDHGAGPGVHHADYAPDGSIVFEAEFDGGEQIWRLGDGAPTVVNGTFSNDNSPCVLSDGRIASLWLDRPGGEGGHELKLMEADGSSDTLLLKDVDIWDVGLGCGG